MKKYFITFLIVAVALLMIFIKYREYAENPWTRDGQVNANIIQITPRVSGPIVSLPIADNQFVKKGEVLFEIDSRTFEQAYRKAKANLDDTYQNVRALEKEVLVKRAGVLYAGEAVAGARALIDQANATLKRDIAERDRQRRLQKERATSQKMVDQALANYQVSLQGKISAEAQYQQVLATRGQAQADLAKAISQLGRPGRENAGYKAAQAALESARLDLEFTTIRAKVSGYITNLRVHLGSQAVANQAIMALVDTSSYYIDAYFREDVIGPIQPGDQAVVTLMTYPDLALHGRVDSIGWGIAQSDGSAGYQLLPNVAPSFEWIRLAQRIPIKIKLNPGEQERVHLRVGSTASVLVASKTSDLSSTAPAPLLLD